MTAQYRPFVQTKKAEIDALAALPAQTKAAMSPVYVVHAREWDFDRNRPKKSLDDHVSAIPSVLARASGGAVHYLDTALIDVDGLLSTGQSPMEWLIDESAKLGVELTPLVSPQSPRSVLAVAAARTTQRGHPVAVCLESSEWSSITPGVLPAVLAQLGAGPGDVDLILDVGNELGSLAVPSVMTELRGLGSFGDFRSVTVAASAWPSEAPTGKGNHEIARADWSVFRGVFHGCLAEGIQVPDYADWAINARYPAALDIDPKMMNISATFRYASDDFWVLGRGALFKGNGGRGLGAAAVPPMLDSLTSHSVFGSTVKTEAEDWIRGARSGGLSGNATTWRQWAFLRHFQLTVHQLANLP